MTVSGVRQDIALLRPPYAIQIWNELRVHFGCPIGVSLQADDTIAFQCLDETHCREPEVVAFLREQGYPATLSATRRQVLVKAPAQGGLL